MARTSAPERVVVPVSRVCQNACRFCDVADQLDGRPVPGAWVRKQLHRAQQAGARTVVFTGGEVALAPSLVQAVGYARALGLRTAITTNGRHLSDLEPLGRLLAAGLDEATVSIHAADPAIHDLLVGGDRVAHVQAVRALRLLAPRVPTTLRAVLVRGNLDGLRALVDLAADAGVAVDLRGLRRAGRAAEAWAGLAPAPRDVLDAVLDALRHAEARGVALTWSGLPTTGLRTRDLPPAAHAIDAPEEAFLAADLPASPLLAGLAAPGPAALDRLAAARRVPVADLPRLLAAAGTPLVDLPPAAGGCGLGAPDPRATAHVAGPEPTWTLPAGSGPIAVVVDQADPWHAVSTLPALADALRARGAEVRFASIWAVRSAGEAVSRPRPGLLGGLGRRLGRLSGRAPLAHPEAPHTPEDRAAARAALAERLDLRGVEVAVVADHRDAARVRAHPTAAPTLRIHVLDDGLLRDADGALGPQDVLRSPYVDRARLYPLAGVGLHQVRFAPVPVARAHATTWTGGGGVRIAGGAGLDPASAGDHAPAWAAADPLADRPAAVARADALLLPWREALGALPETLAVSLALASGTPILAVETALTRALLRQGLWGRLVDPAALEDLPAATAPPPEAAEAVCVTAWARAILEGDDPAPVRLRPGGTAPWLAW